MELAHFGISCLKMYGLVIQYDLADRYVMKGKNEKTINKSF